MEPKALLRELGLRPRKALGQNFIVNQKVLRQILDAAEIGPPDTVLEIGAGLGTLTQALADTAERVLAVEVDARLVAFLRRRFEASSNVEIVQGDILGLDIGQLLRQDRIEEGSAYKVVANIPYYITSALLRHLLETSLKPQLIVLMVQREVAQRVVAKPGQMSLLAVSVRFYGQPIVVSRVPAGAFYPVPTVDSAIVRIKPHKQLLLDNGDIPPFFRVVRAGFRQRRKQLHNALAHGLALSGDRIIHALSVAGIEKERRAQTLSVGEWVKLYRTLSSGQI
jgi:16S rRNA (adenine1518-N6/adenine1519-N6)-dimethyltransferase